MSKTKLCPACQTPRKYSAKYDAYYCRNCRTWLETCCTDERCRICGGRPPRPPRQGGTDRPNDDALYRAVHPGERA